MSETDALPTDPSADVSTDGCAHSTDDWYLTDQHRRLRRQVRAFAEREVAPHVARMEASPHTVQTQLAQQIAEQGWIGATIPRGYGGMGAGNLAKTLIIEELSRISGAAGAITQASQLGVAKIIHFGNEQQKQTWLPPIAAGNCLPTIAVTEPESGGHVLGIQATARRDGDHYVLNGRKSYVGNSHIGHLHGVVARTGDADTRPSQTLSAFLVEADRPGLTLAPHRPALGLHGFSFGELIFQDCRVPASHLLGDIGDGLAVAYSSSTLYGRPNLTAVALGLHQAIAHETHAFVRDRPRYGATLANLPTIQHKIGLMHSRLMTARLSAYHAAYLLDHGHACDNELINAKLINVESALDSARAAMEIHGAAGLSTDRPLQRLFRDIPATHAPAGTTDIQLLRLAQTALGTEHRQWSQRLASVVNAWGSHSGPTQPARQEHHSADASGR